MSIVKAVRVGILLGIIPLDVYCLPDNTKHLAGKQVTDAIGEPNNSLYRFYGEPSLKALLGKGLGSIQKIKTNEGGSFIPVPIEIATQYWLGMAITKKNSKAEALAQACMIESIERRVDYALGIQVEEEMRNAWMKARIDSILCRRFWTDVIDQYIKANNIPKDKQHWIYIQASDALNQRFFGMKAKDIRSQFNIPASELIRDHASPENLVEIQFVERHAGLTVRQGYNPIKALSIAMDFAGITERPFA